MRLVHLTDPHLSNLDGEKFLSLRGKRWSGYLSWYKNRRKKYLPAVLDKLTEAVKAENADQILLTGDLIQIGLASEIAQAAEWLLALGSAEKVMLVPGNHDTYARGSADVLHQAWSGYLFGGVQPGDAFKTKEFPVLRRLGNLDLIGLSSACVSPVFLARGLLEDRQLEELAKLLQHSARENRAVCLLIHHPPLPGMTKWRKALGDAGKLRSVLERYPPQLVFHGHLHHNRELYTGDSHIYCTAAASSLSDASYRVIDVEDTGDHWEFHMTLKSITLEHEVGVEFLTVDEQSWQTPKNFG